MKEFKTGMLFGLAALLIAVAYWPGLGGPLLLDDFGNLADLWSWLEGERTWQSVVWGNRSGPTGRPIAMLTFVLDAAFWGRDIWHFKLTNLLLHLACGVVAWRLLRRLMARDASLQPHADWLAPLFAFVWMALPINVSSVLYIVQRMAILSTFFMLAGLWCYVAGRQAIERGDKRGIWGLVVGVPLCTALAVFSKENGILLLPLALAMELALFAPAEGSKRSRFATLLIYGALSAPIVALLGLLALRPNYFADGYLLRDFTLVERLLSQPRILWDYVGSILLPHGPSLGLFHDSFPKSTSILAPWTTLPAILGWMAAVAFACRWRKSHPAVLAGLLLFLVGHSLESTVMPLELYFEHRNYLPSLGLLLAVAGLVPLALNALPAPSPLFSKALWLLVVILPLTYLAGMHGRARVWASNDTLFSQELLHRPDSPRLRSVLAEFAIGAGDLETALHHIDAGERASGQRRAMTISLWRAIAYCSTGQAPSEQVYRELEERSKGHIETFAMTAWEILYKRQAEGKCPAIDLRRLSEIGEKWLAQSTLPTTYHHVWRTRYYLARLLADQSRLAEAAEVGGIAWKDSDYNTGVGVFLFQVNASLGNLERCREIHAKLRESYGGNLRLNEAIDTFGKALEDGSIVKPD